MGRKINYFTLYTQGTKLQKLTIFSYSNVTKAGLVRMVKKPDSSESGPASLSAIMAAEVRKNRPAETVPAKKVTTWRQISFDTTQPPPTPPSSAPKNPWKTTPSTAATPISTSDTIAAGPSTNFKQVQHISKFLRFILRSFSSQFCNLGAVHTIKFSKKR